MPHHQAAAAQSTTAPMAAHRAREAASGPPPKEAMEYTVSATDGYTDVTHSTPRKLHTAARSTARRKDSAPVTTAPAMALGASVQPFTSSTPRVRNTDRARAGFSTAWVRNVEKEAGMRTHLMPTV